MMVRGRAAIGMCRGVGRSDAQVAGTIARCMYGLCQHQTRGRARTIYLAEAKCGHRFRSKVHIKNTRTKNYPTNRYRNSVTLNTATIGSG